VQEGFTRHLLIAAGTLCVVLGLVGVVVPVLPTTPFLLLAAACYGRSSPRLLRWLLHNRLFGEYLRRYHAGEGMSLQSKVTTLGLLWITLGLTLLWLLPPGMLWVRLLILAMGGGVTWHLLRIPTCPAGPPAPSQGSPKEGPPASRSGAGAERRNGKNPVLRP
jgi:uncharacterized membrane protein YbaN (DUF454 family)